MPKVAKATGKTWQDNWADILLPIDSMKQDVEVIPSGSLALDLALQIGGIPKGYLVRIYGKKGTLKTTLCQRTAAHALEMGMPVMWIDAETSFIPYIAKANGLPGDDERFRVWRQKPGNEKQLTYETMATVIEAWVRDREWAPNGALFIVDSISALVTKAMLAGSDKESNVENAHVAEISKMNARWFPQILPLLQDTGSTLICTQQMRAKIGAMGWGEHEDPGGGWALHHYASVEIGLKHIKKEENGNRIRFDIKANRLAHGYVEGEYSFRKDYGLDTPREIVELGIEFGIVEKKGAWFYWTDAITGEKIGCNGMDESRQWFINNPDQMDAIENKIRESQKRK